MVGANVDAGTDAFHIDLMAQIKQGNTYLLTYDIISWEKGGVRGNLGATNIGSKPAIITGPGKYSEYISATAEPRVNNHLYIQVYNFY